MTHPTQLARHAADKRLRDTYAEEWAALYDEERAARGLPPLAPRRRQKIADLEVEIARLRRLLAGSA